MSDLRFDFAIEKIDQSKRTVSGWATSEDLDRQGDVYPFKSAVASFTKAASWMGVREQHDPLKAIGRLDAWKADEDGKRIWSEVFISRSRDGEDTWTKVNEKILKGFSIAGRCTDFHWENGVRILDAVDLTELSLVDVPANPNALIVSVVKLADGAPGDASPGTVSDDIRKTANPQEARMTLTDALLEKAGITDTQKYLLECVYRDQIAKGGSISDALSSISDTLSGSSDPAAQQASAALSVLADLSSSSSSTSSFGSSPSSTSSSSDGSDSSLCLSSTGSSFPPSRSTSGSTPSSSSSGSSPSSSSSSGSSPSSSSSGSSPSSTSSGSSKSSPSSTSSGSSMSTPSSTSGTTVGKGVFEGAVTADQRIPTAPAGTADGGAMGALPTSAMGVTLETLTGAVDAAVNARLAALLPPTVAPQPGIAEQTAKADEVTAPKGDVPVTARGAGNPLAGHLAALREGDMKKFADLCGEDQGRMDTVKDTLAKSELSNLGITSAHLLTRIGA